MIRATSFGCVLLLAVFTVSQFPWGSTGGMGNWGLFPTMTYEYEQPSSYSFTPGGISNVGGILTYKNPSLSFGDLILVNSTNPQPWGFPMSGGGGGAGYGGGGAGYAAGVGALDAMSHGMSNTGYGLGDAWATAFGNTGYGLGNPGYGLGNHGYGLGNHGYGLGNHGYGLGNIGHGLSSYGRRYSNYPYSYNPSGYSRYSLPSYYHR